VSRHERQRIDRAAAAGEAVDRAATELADEPMEIIRMLVRGRSIAEIEPAVRSVAQLATLRAVVRRVRVEVELAAPLAPARIAGDALRQILLNLALNAIEAAPEGGSVRIAAAERAGTVEIALEDDGPGVPEALRARVFEPFFSTKSQPGGLGLAITRRLVEDAGGTLEVQSRTPTGSRCCVTLPLAR